MENDPNEIKSPDSPATPVEPPVESTAISETPATEPMAFGQNEPASEPATPAASIPTGIISTETPAELPDELKGWNWGAFFLNWIWAIGNSVWIGLLALVGPVSLIMAIILGIKGNEWAWKNRKFSSIEQFKAVQKAWAIWGVVLFLVSIALSVAIAFMVYQVADGQFDNTDGASFYDNTELYQDETDFTDQDELNLGTDVDSAIIEE